MFKSNSKTAFCICYICPVFVLYIFLTSQYFLGSFSLQKPDAHLSNCFPKDSTVGELRQKLKDLIESEGSKMCFFYGVLVFFSMVFY